MFLGSSSNPVSGATLNSLFYLFIFFPCSSSSKTNPEPGFVFEPSFWARLLTLYFFFCSSGSKTNTERGFLFEPRSRFELNPALTLFFFFLFFIFNFYILFSFWFVVIDGEFSLISGKSNLWSCLMMELDLFSGFNGAGFGFL
ncbi:hypothetical protein ACOSQ3_021148 [Xanthoceras sorbifolium]